MPLRKRGIRSPECAHQQSRHWRVEKCRRSNECHANLVLLEPVDGRGKVVDQTWLPPGGQKDVVDVLIHQEAGQNVIDEGRALGRFADAVLDGREAICGRSLEEVDVLERGTQSWPQLRRVAIPQ